VQWFCLRQPQALSQSGAARRDGGGEVGPQGAIIGPKAMIINELVSGFLGVAELALPEVAGGTWDERQ